MPAARRLCLISMVCLGSGGVWADDDLKARVAGERAADSEAAYAMLEKGDVAYLSEDFKTAVGEYAGAVEKLPAGAGAVAGLRVTAVERLAQASLARAQQLVRLGDYDQASALLDRVELVDPKNAEVAVFRAKMENPIRTNPSLTPEHAKKVDQVRRLLYEAEGYFDLGRFDRAMITYEDVLRIDPYNKAARRGMERTNAEISDYAKAARDESRATALKEVSAQWEQKVPAMREVVVGGDFDLGGEIPQDVLMTKLNGIRVPEVTLDGASLDEAVDYLRAISIDLDTTTFDENRKGVMVVVQLGDEDHPAVQKVRSQLINLKLRNVPLSEVLRLITEQTGTVYRLDEFAVVINVEGFDDPTLVRKEFKVPPGFLMSAPVAGGNVGNDPFAGAAPEGRVFARTLSAEEVLKNFGVSFPEGATASVNRATNTLTVRNTAANLQLIEAIVGELAASEPVIIAIRTTLIDITQANLEELGFDVMLGEFDLGEMRLSGGTTGSGDPIEDMIGGRPVTSGLRAGELSTAVDSLDSLLNRESPPTASGVLNTSNGAVTASSISQPAVSGGGAARAPGALSLRGIVNNSAHEILLRAISQKKGVDVMVQPAVMTMPGQNASVQSVMQFPYPEDYEPPQIPNAVAGGGGIVTPATPTSFTTTDLGVTLEVLPQVDANRQIIELSVVPTIRDFEGFVNYGTPIVGATNNTNIDFVTGDSATSSVFGEITPNAILKPLFRTIRGNTSVRILDGQTIVMGGMIQEVRKNVDDKVPILGDLPLIGRVFSHRGMSVEKRSVLIFVNVELVDAAGNPYRNR